MSHCPNYHGNNSRVSLNNNNNTKITTDRGRSPGVKPNVVTFNTNIADNDHVILSVTPAVSEDLIKVTNTMNDFNGEGDEIEESVDDDNFVNKVNAVTSVPLILDITDVVFLKNDGRLGKPYSKFSPRWLGPYVITRKISDVNYEIKPIYKRGRKIVVHVNRLKKAKIDESEPFLCTNRNEILPKQNDTQTIEHESDSDNEVLIGTRVANPRPVQPPRYALRSHGPINSPPPLPPLRRRNTVLFNAVIQILLMMIIMLG